MNKQYEMENHIDISAPTEVIYNHFVNRPQLFPSARILETRLPLALRALAIGYPKGFWNILIKKREIIDNNQRELKAGMSFGPFEVLSIDPNKLVSFRLETPLVKAEFDMVFTKINEKLSRLSMKENFIRNSILNKLFLAMIMPVHTNVMVKKMLKIYKKEIERKIA